MPTGELKTMQDCEDFIQGCLIYGTGGGGSPETGRYLLSEALKEGLSLRWVDADDIPDDVLTASVGGMGSIAPVTESTLEAIKTIGLEELPGFSPINQALNELQEYVGRKIGCIVPVELGASNTPAPLVTGARFGLPVVDGDYGGRAAPDGMQFMPFMHHKDTCPAVFVDHWGNVTIVKHAQSTNMLERLGKYLANAAFVGTMMAVYPYPAHEMKELLVRGTLSRCFRVGQAIRIAKENGKDPIEAILAETGGWRLFEGKVVKKDWEDLDGYMYGTISIRGSGKNSGHTLDVWFKNENHVTWLDGTPWVCSPDLVSIADLHTGEGRTNTTIARDDEVAVLGMKGLTLFRTEWALQHACGPHYFGFKDIQYSPIEDVVA
jgi:uncharacterized protein